MMDPSTIVCRCEEINIDEIESAMKNGAETFDDIKRLTRCGMGTCQAKICFGPVSEIIAEYLDKPLEVIQPPRMRMPIKPVRLSALVSEREYKHVASVFGESIADGDSNG